jgi:cytochrome c biogenesis protein CcdA
MGLMTLGYALTSLGFLRLPTLQARLTGPRLPGKDRPYRRSFLLGATFGGGMGIACPMPTYYLILGWVVAAASPLYGTVLMASYGLGRVVPALAIGALLAGGANRRVVSRRMAWVQEHIEYAHCPGDGRDRSLPAGVLWRGSRLPILVDRECPAAH